MVFIGGSLITLLGIGFFLIATLIFFLLFSPTALCDDFIGPKHPYLEYFKNKNFSYNCLFIKECISVINHVHHLQLDFNQQDYLRFMFCTSYDDFYSQQKMAHFANIMGQKKLDHVNSLIQFFTNELNLINWYTVVKKN
jgi:hypothetical protein